MKTRDLLRFAPALILCLLFVSSALAAGEADTLCAYSEEEIKALKEKADDGDAGAQYELALYYLDTEEYKKAVRELEKSGAQGNPDAQFKLAGIYYDGIVILKDNQAAFTWYEKAGEQGVAEAQFILGLMHYYGRGGVDKDSARAFDWFEKAAKHELPKAQYHLGLMYASGRGVEKNMKKAKYWIKKSDENGFEKAKDAWEVYELWQY